VWTGPDRAKEEVRERRLVLDSWPVVKSPLCAQYWDDRQMVVNH
jgi:hypothetical protein